MINPDDTKFIVSGCSFSTHQDWQEQSHVSPTKGGKEHGIDHELDVGGGERREQVDDTAQDQVGFVVVVLMHQVLVCHPARSQLSHCFCYTCVRQEPNKQTLPHCVYAKDPQQCH